MEHAFEKLESDLLAPVRRVVSDAVRSRVVGPNPDQRARELFDAPGDRWFADDRPIKVVHADTSMFIGGLRALLFQSLHPLAMAGVAQHSDYRRDPWGRLQRTADFLAATTFGPAEESQRAIDMVKSVHRRVRGTAGDGRSYSADDPHLLEWVHLAEIDSFLVAHDRFGRIPLTSEQKDAYVEDMARIATGLGVVDPPRTVAAMQARLGTFRTELRGTPEARSAARYLLVPPALPMAARPAYGLMIAAAISLLPVWARLHLRLPWLPVGEKVVIEPASRLLVSTLRWALAPTAPFTPKEQLGIH